MPFEFEEGELAGVQLITPTRFTDDRGELIETYLEEDFVERGIDNKFIQDKFSRSKKNVLRGLHYQKGRYAQAKLIRCSVGTVLDVLVDLRTNSPTFGEHSTQVLSEHNNRMIFQPRGFAHGFLVLSDWAQFHYKIDNEYAPTQGAGIAWNDSTLDIDWPIDDPILSDKDCNLPTFEEQESNLHTLSNLPEH